jgi:hypothetical protein
MEAPKFFASNVRGIFLGGDAVGLDVEGSVVGTVVGDTKAVGSVLGDAVSSVRLHPEARAQKQTPATIDVTIQR